MQFASVNLLQGMSAPCSGIMPQNKDCMTEWQVDEMAGSAGEPEWCSKMMGWIRFVCMYVCVHGGRG